MYKRIKTRQGVGGLDFIDRYVLYTLEEVDYQLIVKKLSTSRKIFVSDEGKINQYYLYKDYLAYVPMGEKATHLINLRTVKKKTINVFFGQLSDNTYKNTYHKINENELIVYDLITGNIISRIPKKIEGYIHVNNEDFIVTRKEWDHIYCYDKINFNLLWHQDIKTIFPKLEKVVRSRIYPYKDSLIVLTDAGAVRLNLSDGILIWKTNDYARTIEIVNNIGYVCTSGSLYKINLDDGIISDYDREYGRLPDFEYKNKTYWASGHRVVYHEGLLWYSVYSSGCSFLIAINPHDGHYEWMHYVDTYERTDEPIFHENNMFLRDSGSNLHIYEKDALENDTDFKNYFTVIE